MVTTKVITFISSIHQPYLLWQPLITNIFVIPLFAGGLCLRLTSRSPLSFLRKKSYRFLGHAKLCISSITTTGYMHAISIEPHELISAHCYLWMYSFHHQTVHVGYVHLFRPVYTFGSFVNIV